MKNSRRSFLQILAGATAGILLHSGRGALGDAASSDRLGQLLPKRKLGRTGESVTMLGVGGWHIGRMSERDAQETIETALAGGIRFFDSSESYQNGGSESRLGKLLTPKYRDAIFLMTKTDARNAANARQSLDDSLRRMNTDHLDLWQMHDIGSPGDADGRLQAGVLDVFLEAKAAGKVRHIGFTGHHDPSAHLRMLEAKSAVLDTCQMPVNLADPSYLSFIKNVMPKLVSGSIGILAMKTLANGNFFGGPNQESRQPGPHLVPDRVSLADALHFVWSLPVSVLISGPDNSAQIQEKITLARSFTGMTEADRQTLIAKVADLAGKRIEYYKV
jgi:aryl-alcohol dehydrogenase-like predicted oxidoreductase